MVDRKVRSNQQPTVTETASVEPTDEGERSLEQRLWNISQASDSGRIRGYIDECELTDDDTIRVHIRLPNAEMHTQTFPMPGTDSAEYAFVRLVEDCGYSLASAGQLAGGDGTEGAQVWCEPTDIPKLAAGPPTDDDQSDTNQNRTNDWRLVVPEYTPPLRKRIQARLDTLNWRQVTITLAVGGGLLLLPVLFPILIFQVALDDDPPDPAMTLAVGITALLLWSVGIWALYTTMLAPIVDLPAVETLL